MATKSVFFFSLTVIMFVTAISSIFVSRNGLDEQNCGNSTDQSCGTLYFAATLLNENITEVYIINGQNPAILNNYMATNHTYHPCLPQTIAIQSNIHITITFDESIQHITDWYPQICIDYDLNNTNNNNTQTNYYMFAATKTHLTLNNLHIDLSVYTGINFGIIRVSNDYDNQIEAQLTCNDCTFQNIANINEAMNMIYCTNSITFNNAIFSNVHSINDFIVMGKNTLDMNNILVSDCTFDESFIRIEDVSYDYGAPNNINFENCQFSNISAQNSLVNDQWISCDLSIFNVNFNDIHHGFIYRGAYEFGSSVRLKNIKVTTSQLFSDDIDALFNFNFADTVEIENITVEYGYDITKRCVYVIDALDSHSRMNASYVVIQCDNPIALISNFVSMTINNAVLSIDISEEEMELLRQQHYADYDYIALGYVYHPTYALISNQGELYVANMSVKGLTIARRMFHNYHILNIDNFQVIAHSNYSPNALQSTGIIKQSRATANITVRNSLFIGGFNIIHIQGGIVSVYDTAFQDAAGAFEVKSADNILISACTFYRVGRYWSNVAYANQNTLQILYIEGNAAVQQRITIENSHFSGYDDFCSSLFLLIKGFFEVTLRNNYFIVDASDLYYNIPSDKITLNAFKVYGLVWIYGCGEVSIYGNDFYKNDVNPAVPWLFLMYNRETSCLSANNFSNYALLLHENNVTSCFRQALLKCIGNECQHGEYGDINEELFDKTSHFNIDIDAGISSFYTTSPYSSSALFYAMDNIQINVLDGNGETVENANWSLIISYSNILIMDSVFPSNVNVLYPNVDGHCSVVNNDRLTNNETYIAKLLILCDSKNVTDLRNLLTNTVHYVNHLSATQMHFSSISATYYPGEKLKFDYQIFDKLNNPIHEHNYSFSSSDDIFTVNVFIELLGLSQDLVIADGGECVTCDSGVIIVGIGLDDVTTTHSMQTSLINDNLVLMDDAINVHVVSCPVGYGTDSNNYQCHVCPAGTYNLLANNTERCRSCDQENNKGIKCYEGEVFVKTDHWIGFGPEDAAYTDMTAELCPAWYCCNDKEQCNYNNATNLCAGNRNPFSALCGACLPGYSQAMNSTKCIKCDGHDYGYLFLPCVLSICFTLYLIRSHPKKDLFSAELAHKNRCCLNLCPNACETHFFGTSNKAFFLMLSKTLILRVIIFYEQALSSILWPSSITSYSPYMYSIASLFNLEINIPDNNNDNMHELWCFFDGIDAKGKILAGLIPSVMTIALLLTLFIFIKLGNCLKCQFQCESMNYCKSQAIASRHAHVYRCCNTNYGKAFVALWIICVGQLLSVSFKILNCQPINHGDKYVHFYFGEEECSIMSATTILCICFISCVVISFGSMLFVLMFSSVARRENPNFALNTLCKYYKTDCYFWEFVILIRRVLITMYAILYRWQWYPIILITFLLFFIGIHYKYQPFKAKQANIFEYLSLCCTVIVICIHMTSMYVPSSAAGFNATAPSILTLFIIVPIFAVFLYLITMLIRIHQHPTDENYMLHEVNAYSAAAANVANNVFSSSEIQQTPQINIANTNTVTFDSNNAPIHCNNPTPLLNDNFVDGDDDSMDYNEYKNNDNEQVIELELEMRYIAHCPDRQPSIGSDLDYPQYSVSQAKVCDDTENAANTLKTPLCERQISVKSTDSTHV